MTKHNTRVYPTTRKHPRTLQEAFGPYTSNRIDEANTQSGYGRAWWFAIYCIALAAFVVIATTGPA